MTDYSAPTVMFVDIETSGLYRKDLSIDDPAQPWVMTIGVALCNDEGRSYNHFFHMIRAEGRTVKDGAQKVHGIPVSATAYFGIQESRILGILLDMLKTAPFDEELKIVSFGDFDPMVLSSLFARFAVSQKKPSNTYDKQFLRRAQKRFINLQTPILQTACKIRSQFEDADYKWPSLDEACEIILGMAPRPGEHDAWEDMLRLKALYFECLRRGYIKWKDPSSLA